jgi:hypothetical protein
LQTHLNQKGHLEAIENLIALFHQKLLQNPPQKTENLQECHSQIHRLRSLKNDYFFAQQKGDSSFIDSRLKEIEQQAYSIFTYYHKQQAQEQEELRKQAFIQFEEHVEEMLEQLAEEYASGLLKGRLLIIAPPDMLSSLFEERVTSLDRRIEKIDILHQQLLEMEMFHKGKFTIPFIEDKLNSIKRRLCHEIHKLKIEAELIITHLIWNYRLTLSKEESQVLLDNFQANPAMPLEDFSSISLLFKETLETEIQRIKEVLGRG